MFGEEAKEPTLDGEQQFRVELSALKLALCRGRAGLDPVPPADWRARRCVDRLAAAARSILTRDLDGQGRYVVGQWRAADPCLDNPDQGREAVRERQIPSGVQRLQQALAA